MNAQISIRFSDQKDTIWVNNEVLLVLRKIKMIFSMKLQQHKSLKLTQMIFWGKYCIGVLGQKVPENEFLKFYNVSGDWVSLIVFFL